MPDLARAGWDTSLDDEVVERVRAGESALYEYSDSPLQSAAVPRGAVHSAGRCGGGRRDAGDVRAYEHLSQFAGL